MASKSGLTYVVHPFVIWTVRVVVLMVVVMVFFVPNSPTPSTKVRFVVEIGSEVGNVISIRHPWSSGTGAGKVN